MQLSYLSTAFLLSVFFVSNWQVEGRRYPSGATTGKNSKLSYLVSFLGFSFIVDSRSKYAATSARVLYAFIEQVSLCKSF